jgi:hypothetical protein
MICLTPTARLPRRQFLTAAAAAAALTAGANRRPVRAADPLRIGVINDGSGPYAASSGRGA